MKKDREGMGPAKMVILVQCPSIKNHLNEPLGVYIHQMWITFWNDEVMQYEGEPIPRDIWVWVFQPVEAETVFERCSKCKHGY